MYITWYHAPLFGVNVVFPPTPYIHTLLEISLSLSTPSADGRRALLDINLRDVKMAEDCDLDEIAKLTEGYSGADITNVCR